MNIFSYESKLMQTLMVIGDYIILNLMFLVFSIPIFTIGAAQAGLYSGIKVALDKEDDSSCAAAFSAAACRPCTCVCRTICTPRWWATA